MDKSKNEYKIGEPRCKHGCDKARIERPELELLTVASTTLGNFLSQQYLAHQDAYRQGTTPKYSHVIVATYGTVNNNQTHYNHQITLDFRNTFHLCLSSVPVTGINSREDAENRLRGLGEEAKVIFMAAPLYTYMLLCITVS